MLASTYDAYIVTGLGFGDEGKGITTAALAYKTKSRLVVRHNGGSQAGHNVSCFLSLGGITKTRSHCFSQFGSGTFTGASTYLSEYVLINPLTLLNEGLALSELIGKSVFDEMYIHPDAFIIHPYHVLVNHFEEEARGETKHGSCGHGIGVCREMSLNPNISKFQMSNFQSCDTKDLELLLAKHRYWASHRIQGSSAPKELKQKYLNLINEVDIIELVKTYQLFASIVRVCDYHELQKTNLFDEPIIFEGAQGVMLDEDMPSLHITWTKTTDRNAWHICDVLGFYDDEVHSVGVTRTFATRHGAGPFNDHSVLTEYIHNIPDERNTINKWQGSFRCAPLEINMLKSAIEYCDRIDSFAITWVDHYLQLRNQIFNHLSKPSFYDYDSFKEAKINLEKELDIPNTILSSSSFIKGQTFL